jgi:hypothetical protein
MRKAERPLAPREIADACSPWSLPAASVKSNVHEPSVRCPGQAAPHPMGALYSVRHQCRLREGPVGVKWTARLRVDFEMEDGAPENLAQNRLRTAVGQLEHFIETSVDKKLVKQGSAKVEIVAQGPTTW